jgi:hypothetical protein
MSRSRSYSPPRTRLIISEAVFTDKLHKVQKELEDIITIYNNNKDITGISAVDSDPAVRSAVATMCHAMMIFEPKIRVKMGELIYTNKFDWRNPNIKLRTYSATHGADIYDERGNNFEHKLSTLREEYGTANFNWPIPLCKGLDSSAKLEKMIESIKKKISVDGKAIHEIMYNGVIIAHFEYTQAFIIGYFSHINLGRYYNLTCKRCTTCNGFHKLSIMQKYSDDLDNHINDNGAQITDEWWNRAAKHPNHCRTTAQIISGPCTICSNYHNST